MTFEAKGAPEDTVEGVGEMAVGGELDKRGRIKQNGEKR